MPRNWSRVRDINIFSGTILKKMKKKLLSGLSGVLAFSFFSGAVAADSGKIKTYVSILPQAYFVKRVGGPYVDVEVLVGPGQSPATYEPTPKQMAGLGKAQVYFRIGTPFERGFLDKVAETHKYLQIVDTREGVRLRYFKRSMGRSVPDPHIWLDPGSVEIQAATICRVLSRLLPKQRSFFVKELRRFRSDLDRVDKNIAKILAPLKGSKFYVFHPAFGYFGDRYGLEQVAVEIEGKEPSPKQLSNLINRARKEGVKVIFVQPQYAKKEAETIAREIGGAVVPMNPLPRDYLENLEKMAGLLRKALKKE
jgi:zinc transport system substrate-binding protein